MQLFVGTSHGYHEKKKHRLLRSSTHIKRVLRFLEMKQGDDRGKTPLPGITWVSWHLLILIH